MGIEERCQTKEIDGTFYLVRPLPCAAGYKAMLRLVKIAGPIIAQAIVGSDVKTGTARSESVAEAIGLLASSIKDEDIGHFAKLFGESTMFSAEGSDDPVIPLKLDQQEMHFSGRYMAFFEWLMFAIEVNFGGFFGDLSKRLAK